MAKGSETVSIRVSNDVKAALDIIIGERRAAEGKSVTISEAIWHLVEKAEKHVADRVIELQQENTDREEPA